MLNVTDDQLKDLVYSLVVDSYPGYGAYSEVLWDNVEGFSEASEEEMDQVLDRLSRIVETAQINISWPDEVD